MTFLAALSETKFPEEVMQSEAIMTPPLYFIEIRVVPMLTGWYGLKLSTAYIYRLYYF
jgi:hypothetical protein